MNNGIKMDYAKKQIIITKGFEKAAGEINSAEYKVLQTAMKDFPTFEIRRKEIKKKENKTSYRGLTYAIMEDFSKR